MMWRLLFLILDELHERSDCRWRLLCRVRDIALDRAYGIVVDR